MGIKEGKGKSNRTARQTEERKSQTSRFWALREVTTVRRRATNWLPASDWLPKLVRRQITAGLRACSAALLVGSSPICSTNVQRAVSSLRICRQDRIVWAKGDFSLFSIGRAAAVSNSCLNPHFSQKEWVRNPETLQSVGFDGLLVLEKKWQCVIRIQSKNIIN